MLLLRITFGFLKDIFFPFVTKYNLIDLQLALSVYC